MDVRRYGFTRREIRGGAGGGASEHFEEMIGSTEFYMYRHPNSKIKGYETLKLFSESQGCDVLYIAAGPTPVGKGFETVRITNNGREIPIPVLKRAHNWAHRRNLLHLFYKERATARGQGETKAQ